MFSTFELTKLNLSSSAPKLSQKKRRARRVHSAAVARSMTLLAPYHPTVNVEKAIREALSEDLGDHGDITTMATIPSTTTATATFLAKVKRLQEEGVLAGTEVAGMVFREVDPEVKVEWTKSDGMTIDKGQIFGRVSGNARSILIGERTALNYMQRMSGIATSTRVLAEAAAPAKVLETRKTAPGMRLFDKWAVMIGGGLNHRMGLFDAIMIKDNHIASAGSVAKALESAQTYLSAALEFKDIPILCEARTLQEVEEVMKTWQEGRVPNLKRVMLDNMTPRAEGTVDVSMLEDALKIINGRVETEATGNITIETAPVIGTTGVTYLSCGALTHSVKALDISLNVETSDMAGAQ